jgi:hypothetical protein
MAAFSREQQMGSCCEILELRRDANCKESDARSLRGGGVN